MRYVIGDKVTHPKHGAGVIEAIEERAGTLYYVFRMPANAMIVLIPQEAADTIGVRPVIDSSQAEELLTFIATSSPEHESNWAKRFRDNNIRVKSGDLHEVGLVAKALTIRDTEKGLSSSERKLLHSATVMISSEIAIAFGISGEAATDRLKEALTDIGEK